MKSRTAWTAFLLIVLAQSGATGEPFATEEIVKRSEASVAFIAGKHWIGSGFVIQPGVIITNRHVVHMELDNFIRVHFPSTGAGPLKAALLYEDSQNDLAFLCIDSEAVPLPIRRDRPFPRGADIIAIGNPSTSGGQVLKNAVNKGVISTEAVIDGRSYWQMGLSINPGNSGGPIIDEKGQVLGVATLADTGKQGITYCIPPDQILAALERLNNLPDKQIEKGRSEHRFRVLTRLVRAMAESYAQVMKFNVEALRIAKDHHLSPETLIYGTGAKVRALCSGYDRSHLEEIQTAIKGSEHDPYLTRADHEEFARLWLLYTQIKSLAESPHTRYQDYRGSCERLCEQLGKIPKP